MTAQERANDDAVGRGFWIWSAVIIIPTVFLAMLIWSNLWGRIDEIPPASAPGDALVVAPSVAAERALEDDRGEFVSTVGYRALASQPVVRIHAYAAAEASSMAVERQEDRIVVTNPPEVPVEVVPGSELERLICSYDWHCGTALRIARCESTMRPDVVSPTNDFGLMQINGVHRARWQRMGYSDADMLTPGPNLAVAHAIWSEQGWRPWSCAR